jgi:hypothetical protein
MCDELIYKALKGKTLECFQCHGEGYLYGKYKDDCYFDDEKYPRIKERTFLRVTCPVCMGSGELIIQKRGKI